MRITELLELRMRSTLLRMRSTLLRMRINNLKEIFSISQRIFLKIWSKIGQKTEFIPARPHHQNIKKSESFS